MPFFMALLMRKFTCNLLKATPELPPAKFANFKDHFKQASRQWNLESTRFLLSKGFLQSKSDYSLFSKHHNGKQVFLLVYVDDLLIIGDDVDGIAAIKQALHLAYSIKDLGLARYFLCIEISRRAFSTFLNQ